MGQILAFVFYTIFFSVSVVVLTTIGLYSIWISIFSDEEIDPEDRIFK